MDSHANGGKTRSNHDKPWYNEEKKETPKKKTDEQKCSFSSTSSLLQISPSIMFNLCHLVSHVHPYIPNHPIPFLRNGGYGVKLGFLLCNFHLQTPSPMTTTSLESEKRFRNMLFDHFILCMVEYLIVWDGLTFPHAKTPSPPMTWCLDHTQAGS